jgi:hypothetical protein
MSSTDRRNSVRRAVSLDILAFFVRRHITTTARLNWGFSLTTEIVCGNHQFDWQVSRSDMPTSAFLF